MRDPYVYPHTNILKNLANVQDEKQLSCMEAEYTSLRLAELVTKESASRFDFTALCDVHHYIFQDDYEWAGEIRVINIEKSEPALGGISIEYYRVSDTIKKAGFEGTEEEIRRIVYWNRLKHYESDVEEYLRKNW